jgi:hypothetical protein
VTPLAAAVGVLAIVDRIEGDIAVLEWGEHGVTEVPVVVLPVGVSEGDTVRFRTRRVSKGASQGPEGGLHGVALSRPRVPDNAGIRREE